MNITDPLVLRNDVVLVPVTELAPDVRAKIDHDEGDYTLTRLHGRMVSQVIDGETASLLKIFREPTTIADAVIRNSRELARDPQRWLDELLPHLGTFLMNHVLVPAGENEPELKPFVERGERVGGWEIEKCINLMEDSEIHRVRRGDVYGAMKIARVPSVIANETAILEHLAGASVVPQLLDCGIHEGRSYLVVEWCDGADAGVTASSHGRHDREALLEICASIADAYAELHARGVIHADVHPRNVMIGPDRRVRLIDFGLSRIDGSALPLMPRGGMYYFFEPEYLTYGLAATYAGEQYALAALIYLILTCKHYLEFRFDREEMMRQARTESPLPFDARGVPPWPEVESVLRRALDKDPAQRFPSVREMANALRAARTEEEVVALPAIYIDALEYRDAPKASINYGAAGAAVGVLHIAEARGDAKLLARADVWRSRAARYVGVREGWWDDVAAPEAMVGTLSPYHTVSGLHAAEAFIAYARADRVVQQRAIRNFIEASSAPCASDDLTLGRSGSLLIAALLYERDPVPELRAFGDALLATVRFSSNYAGIAHGWSGYLYAVLRWCLASGSAIPAHVAPRLHELAMMRIPRGRGACWPRIVGGGLQDMMPGWCNGAAGHVFTFATAYDALRERRWLEVAEAAAWNAWEEPLYGADLCCGSAGRAYALLALYRRTGERAWVHRARKLAQHAAQNAGESHALWKGRLGVAALLADMESPDEARMPFFE